MTVAGACYARGWLRAGDDFAEGSALLGPGVRANERCTIA